MQRRQILRIAITIVSTLAILWIAGGVNQYIDDRTYNKCKIADQKFKYDTSMKCEEVLNQP